MTDHSISAIEQLKAVVAKLRDDKKGCAWNKKQTFETFAPYVLEEADEVIDAIARGDWADLQTELGDLLYQVVFLCHLAGEGCEFGGKPGPVFTLDDVAEGAAEKMMRRHPNVFGDVTYASEAEQDEAWEKLKQEERKGKASSNAQCRRTNGLSGL